MDPYRSGLVRDETRTLLPEPERPPPGVYVRAWTDGTTEIRLGGYGHWPGCVFIGGIAFVLSPLAAWLLGRAGIPFAFVTVLGVWALIPERITVTPAGFSCRRFLWRRPTTFAHDDVSEIELESYRKASRVMLRAGDDRVAIGEWFGRDENVLRWIAQRLRRAIVEARR